MTLDNFMIHHYFVILEVSSPILNGAYKDIFVTKLFMISVQFMKITKIFDHENLELYGMC